MTDTYEILKMLAALLFVLGLMGGLAFLIKKAGLNGPNLAKPRLARLKILESIPIDARRRLVLVQRDDLQHLVIVGATSETVIETGIKAPDNENHA